MIKNDSWFWFFFSLEKSSGNLVADLKGYYGIMASCTLPDGGQHKGIFGWEVNGDGADTVAKSGESKGQHM